MPITGGKRAAKDFPWRAFVICLALGLVLRLGFVLATPPALADWTPGDRHYYHQLAVGLISGQGLVDDKTSLTPQPTAFTVPGTALYLAGLYRLFGPHPQVVRVANCLLETGTIASIFLFTFLLWRRPGVATLAALGYVLSPWHVLKTGDWDTIVPATFLVGLAMVADRVLPARGRGLGVGFVVGLACMVRPALGLVAPVLLLLGRPRPDRGYLGDLVLAGLGGAVAIAPWVVRNYLVFHAFIPFGYQSSWVMYRGWLLNGLTTPASDAVALRVAKQVGGVAMQSIYWHETMRVIAADPGHAAVLALQKFCRFWWHLCMAAPPEPKHLASALGYGLGYHLPALAAMRRPSSTSGDPYRTAFWTLVALASLAHMATYASVAYSLPYYPLLLPAVALGWSRCRARLPRQA